MRNAAAGCAAHRAECPVALDVLLRVLRMACDADGAELVVGPKRTQAAADGAVAGGGRLWRRRQLYGHSTAMAGSSEHGVGSLNR